MKKKTKIILGAGVALGAIVLFTRKSSFVQPLDPQVGTVYSTTNPTLSGIESGSNMYEALGSLGKRVF